MNKPSRRFILTSALLALALSGGGVLAHHGVTGQYDMSTPIVIGGMVTRTTFAPPHPIVTVRVEKTDVPSGNLDRPDEFRGELVGERRTLVRIARSSCRRFAHSTILQIAFVSEIGC
jgi:hypothetical protein